MLKIDVTRQNVSWNFSAHPSVRTLHRPPQGKPSSLTWEAVSQVLFHTIIVSVLDKNNDLGLCGDYSEFIAPIRMESAV